MTSVDRQVREYFAAQEIPSDRAREILEQAREKARSKREALRRRHLTALAAVLLLTLAGFWLRSTLTTSALADRVAAEVAMNHRKNLDVEVAASSFSSLGTALTKLPFPLADPESAILTDYRLEGGRYCSIQAQLAAQLKLRHERTGRHATLYVTQMTPQLGSLPGTHREAEEVLIEIWARDGLLYALAEDGTPGAS